MVILAAAVITFYIARHHDSSQRTYERPGQNALGKTSGTSLTSSPSQHGVVGTEAEQDGVVEDVLENGWVQWLSFTGTAVFAASFFVEAYMRRGKN